MQNVSGLAWIGVYIVFWFAFSMYNELADYIAVQLFQPMNPMKKSTMMRNMKTSRMMNGLNG